jgi:hypothetical protein
MAGFQSVVAKPTLKRTLAAIILVSFTFIAPALAQTPPATSTESPYLYGQESFLIGAALF